VVADFINLGVMRFALDSVTKEINEVDFERVKGELPPGYKFLTKFKVHCAVFRRMSRWEGLYLIIDKEDYGKYVCLHMSKMKVAELLEFYKVEKLVAMINEAIRNLPPEELEKAHREEARMRSVSVWPMINQACTLQPVWIENNFHGDIDNFNNYQNQL